jgi:hypothetical protein
VKDIRNIIGGKAVLKEVLAKLEPDSGSDWDTTILNQD